MPFQTNNKRGQKNQKKIYFAVASLVIGTSTAIVYKNQGL